MSVSLAKVPQPCRTAHGRIMCATALCAVFSALRHGVLATPIFLGGASLHIDIDVLLLSLCVLGYFVDPRYWKSTEGITKENKLITATSLIGRVVFEGRREALRAVSAEEPVSRTISGIVDDSCEGSLDQPAHEQSRLKSDMYIIKRAKRDGVTHGLPSMLKVMHASIRLKHGEAAVTLFDQMLEKGAVPGAHLIHKAVSSRFFELVAETLDDKRMQIDGLRLLDSVRAHGIRASYKLQNRLLAAWKGRELPWSVVEYLVKMKREGVNLSKWAYRSIVVAYERSDPEFALTICNEMEGSSIQLYREAYNAVLGARLQLGMHNEAHELFMKMVDHAVAPNARSYSIMIRVYSFSGQHKKAVAIFETMRGHPFEPDHIDYHHAIRSCILIQRVEYAVKLYKDAIQAKLSLPASTYVILSRACECVGWKCVANKFETE